jgi:hypothetical protein
MIIRGRRIRGPIHHNAHQFDMDAVFATSRPGCNSKSSENRSYAEGLSSGSLRKIFRRSLNSRSLSSPSNRVWRDSNGRLGILVAAIQSPSASQYLWHFSLRARNAFGGCPISDTISTRCYSSSGVPFFSARYSLPPSYRS